MAGMISICGGTWLKSKGHSRSQNFTIIKARSALDGLGTHSFLFHCCLHQRSEPARKADQILFAEMAAVEGCNSEMRQRQRQRRVVVAVDESEESMHALSWALQFLLFQEAKEDQVILLHAQSPPRVFAAVDGTAYVFSSDIMESLEKQQRENTENVLQKARTICSEKNIFVETKVETGDARDVICEQIEKLQADVLVIGSHGYGTIKRTFLGSVSDYCVRHAKCPVVIVKLPKD